MRIDKHLNPVALSLTSRQHFFLVAWFNMVHQASLDSYRVKAMNPINILRELWQMYEPQADDNDRRIVAEEALEIFANHPVLEAKRERYRALEDTMALLAASVAAAKKVKAESGTDKPVEKQESGFKRQAGLIHSFMRELDASLKGQFLGDCFEWLMAVLEENPASETPPQREAIFSQIERVCRDILSVSDLAPGIRIP